MSLAFAEAFLIMGRVCQPNATDEARRAGASELVDYVIHTPAHSSDDSFQAVRHVFRERFAKPVADAIRRLENKRPPSGYQAQRERIEAWKPIAFVGEAATAVLNCGAELTPQHKLLVDEFAKLAREVEEIYRGRTFSTPVTKSLLTVHTWADVQTILTGSPKREPAASGRESYAGLTPTQFDHVRLVMKQAFAPHPQ